MSGTFGDVPGGSVEGVLVMLVEAQPFKAKNRRRRECKSSTLPPVAFTQD